MPLETVLKAAIAAAMSETISQEIQDIVAKETRRALRDREDDFIRLVRAAVQDAIAEMLT